MDPVWDTFTIGEICDINPDKTDPNKIYPNQSIFYIDISCVENETGHFTGYNEVLSSEAPSRARHGIARNDVLLSTVRPNLKAFTIIENPKERAIASTGFAVLRTRDGVAEPRFILESVRSDYAVNQMIA